MAYNAGAGDTAAWPWQGCLGFPFLGAAAVSFPAPTLSHLPTPIRDGPLPLPDSPPLFLLGSWWPGSIDCGPT